MHALVRSTLTALLLTAGGAVTASAQTCRQADIAAVVEDMSKKLRTANSDGHPRLQARMRELAKLRGWADNDVEDKTIEILEDDETRAQDEHASHLLAQIDKLGQTGTASPTCDQVAELKATAAQLVEITGAKAAHVSAKLDAELKNAKSGTGAEPSPPKTQPKQQTAAAAPAAPPPQPSRAPARPAWATKPAVVAPTPAPAPPSAALADQAPLPPASRPAPVDAASLEFNQEDIRAAGRGVFGTISAELAGIIEYAFKSYGRPTGYIVGKEGGAALLAGLRYGDGTFVTKAGGERKIYWQGPTVGYDLGLTGSRTIILVYNLSDPDEMFQRFGGIDGSAYLIGGVGLTVLKNGPLILAPIRTGLGLRLGANIGYLRFTARPRFNPL